MERLIALIGPIQQLRKEQREVADSALRAVSIAINETYLYYRSLEKGRARSDDTEAQLSRYWAAAAIPLRHIDAELAEVCEYKSEYWVSPETWEPSQIKELGIELEAVRDRYRQRIAPNKALQPTRLKPRG